jgi:hypothetical protein
MLCPFLAQQRWQERRRRRQQQQQQQTALSDADAAADSGLMNGTLCRGDIAHTIADDSVNCPAKPV